ncbi:MAG TPA: fatty acid desaturase [Kofleriaceae bacterium]|nr:fatty acid desaturase [Kofleriaceae bacterium]
MTAIAFSDVRAKGWIVVGDDVYDIARFSSRHPGGPEIAQLRGGDATFPLINAHGIRGELPALPKKLRVGTIDPATLPPADRELRALWTDLKARGMFDYKRWWFALDAIRGLGFFLAGWLTLDTPVIAFFALLVARLNVMWWVHDVCHDSVFRDRDRARWWAEAMSIVFVGTSVLDYQYVVHRIHHGFTNTVGADQAIDTGPVVWHQLMRARTSDTFVQVQSAFWFLVVLPLTLPYFMYIGFRHSLRDERYWTIAAVIARWTIALWLFRDHLVVFLVPSLLSAYLLGLTASLNHFHRPMSERTDWNFPRSVTCVTQNLGATDRVSAWLLGGLSFHIEHHFFATMPRRNYRKIARELEAYCKRHGLPYQRISVPQAIATLWRKLRRPYEDNVPPSRPSMDITHYDAR